MAALAAAALCGGCGGAGDSSTRAPAPPVTARPQRSAPPSGTTTPGNGSAGGRAAPAGGGVPQDQAGPATLSVSPQTTAPGQSFTVVLRAPAGTRAATVSFDSLTVAASAGRSGSFVARVTVPRGTRGGLRPVVASYSGGSTGTVTTQVKVFTP